MEEINENSMTFFLRKVSPTDKKVNIVTALTTEAESPATKANIQRNKTTKIVLINFPFFSLSKGLKIHDKMSKMIPTCKPETAKIWIAPALV